MTKDFAMQKRSERQMPKKEHIKAFYFLEQHEALYGLERVDDMLAIVQYSAVS